ncbi:MAG TPA: hypothetical protein VJ647_02975 [Chitinophagaceae bacterium]|nr:hypothetical protein [Chitinophagaceae bacterium]
MKNLVLLILPVCFLLCCKGKKTKLSDGDVVTVKEFVDFFPKVKWPFQLSDTSLAKKEKDSATIGYKIFTGFVPDTVLTRSFGKRSRPQFYPLGRASVKDGETYLFVKAIAGAKKAAYVLVFDKDNKFITSMLLAASGNEGYISQTAQMEANYTLTLVRRKKAPDGRLVYKKDAYVYNSAGVFILILTESNDVVNTSQAVINPIDTLSKKNKLAGDYVLNTRNFVSIRDGRKPGTILFFIHFEKDKGACKGELKGEAVMAGPNKAVFRQVSGPCMVEFNFSAGSRVSIKETGPCGTFRDIKCFFEGSYLKKKIKKKK